MRDDVEFFSDGGPPVESDREPICDVDRDASTKEAINNAVTTLRVKD